MAKQAALLLIYTGICINLGLFLNASALTEHAASEQLTSVNSSPEAQGRRTAIEPPTTETADEGFEAVRLVYDLPSKSGQDSLGKFYRGFSDGEEANEQPRGSTTTSEKDKRILRLVKRHGKSEFIKNVDSRDARLRRHSLHKRDVSSKEKRVDYISVAAPLSLLTDMMREHEYYRQLAQTADENALKQQLLDLGKRSSDGSSVRKQENALREEIDALSLLQKAIRSSETN